ncbi:predicted protein [Nematostella vectensis]|uniref:Kelch domain-containing protein 10 n=1 Tax=Nematostella vectensis TaxID=45351 RepID=A7SYI0_NEMVE|nr:predicted protein [Nematostella vectensis]|eukprot:XP_001623321.1 predicted protein [Nematostella vectensis]
MAEEGKTNEIAKTINPRNTSPSPLPRSGHRCVADDRNVYVFGGYSPHYSEKLFRELWRFNIASQCWSRVITTGPFPSSVCSSCVLLNKGNLIVYGGSGIPFGQSNSAQLHICLLSKKEWIELETTTGYLYDKKPSLPIPGYGQSMVLSPDQDLYVFAGTTGHMFNCYLSKFSFKTKEWKYVSTQNESVPFPRYRHEAVDYKGSFYVIGGGMGSTDPQEFYNLDKVHAFCYQTNKWQVYECLVSQEHGIPPRRRCHGCVLYKDAVYICGGYDGQTIYNDVWSLDLVRFQWTKLPKILPYPVYFHSAAITPGGCMYIFGGVKSMQADTDARSSDIHKLWLTVPSLLDLSVQCLMSHVPDVEHVSPEKFAELGIPPHLIA